MVGAGSVVIVAAGEPHGFTNTGDGPLRQIDIHVADAFSTDWLEDVTDPADSGHGSPTACRRLA